MKIDLSEKSLGCGQGAVGLRMLWLGLLIILPPSPMQAAITNGDFAKGWVAWTNEGWMGNGVTRIAQEGGLDGSPALEMDFGGQRALMVQATVAFPGYYEAGVWIKCENIEAGDVRMTVEWFNREGKWLGFVMVGSESGTSDWTYHQAQLKAPLETWAARIGLYASEPNQGKAWFDEVTFRRANSKATPMEFVPLIEAYTQEGEEGSLLISWDPQQLPEGAVMLQVFCEEDELTDSTLPRLTAGADWGQAVIRSLVNGRRYHVAAQVLAADGGKSGLSTPVQSTVQDRQPPRPGHARAEWGKDGRVGIAWTPHVLDRDVALLHVNSDTEGDVRTITYEVSQIYSQRRAVFATEPWFEAKLTLPAGATGLYFQTEDHSGNLSESIWVEVSESYSDEETEVFSIALAPPTGQFRHDTDLLPEMEDFPPLRVLQGQSKGFQVLILSEEDLADVRIVLEAPLHEKGGSTIASRWLSGHFVNYVNLEVNSFQTPESERLWQAPGLFPDELSDDVSRNIRKKNLQPVFIRVTVPEGSIPGTYHGLGRIETRAGFRPFGYTLHVDERILPPFSSYKVGHWMKWDSLCSPFGVKSDSEDGWRALSSLAEVLAVYRNNLVKVPWNLIRSWRDSGGELHHDFRDFDRYTDTFLKHNPESFFAIDHIGSRAYLQWVCPEMRSANHRVWHLNCAGDEWVDCMDILPDLEAHLAGRGLLDRFSIHVADEPIAENVQSYRELAGRVHAAAPALRRVDALGMVGGGLEDYLEIHVPVLDIFENNLSSYQQLQADGREVWFYTAWGPQGHYPNRMIDSMAIKPRVLSWINMRYGATGYLHWALNWWDIPLTEMSSPGDQYLVWPGNRFIINSSLRFESHREGLDDWQHMLDLVDSLTAQGMDRETAQELIRSKAATVVRSAQDYSRSWEDYESLFHSVD